MRYTKALAGIMIAGCIGPVPVRSQDATQVLQKTYDKLASYSTLYYKYERKIEYVSENYRSETGGATWLDFRNPDTAVGFRYQAGNKDYLSVYNGAESFYLNKVDTTIRVSLRAQKGHMESLPLFANSILTLRLALPRIIADGQIIKRLSDTLVDGKSCYAAVFVLPNKTLGYLGDYRPVTLKRDFYYKLLVDKKTFLPLQVVQTNSAEPADRMVTIFSDLSADISGLKEESWYYSTYQKMYKPENPKKVKPLDLRAPAPEWVSTFVDSGERMSLGALKGKPVLMEFWIRNCGYCIAAVPELNGLMKKYAGTDLQVIGVNGHDGPEDIRLFYQRNQPGYRTITDKDGTITTKYGVDGFPTVVLIDRLGKVIYVGEVDRLKLEALIAETLK